jgi:methionyl-tRNA formyltransferase
VRPGAGMSPGTLLQAEAGALVVACGRDALQLLQLQRAGGRRVVGSSFLQSSAAGTLVPGVVLPSAAVPRSTER